ncbi:hypothetical protein ABT246_40375 [Streptomyces sp. NPDC001553]
MVTPDLPIGHGVLLGKPLGTDGLPSARITWRDGSQGRGVTVWDVTA